MVTLTLLKLLAIEAIEKRKGVFSLFFFFLYENRDGILLQDMGTITKELYENTKIGKIF
jgi:hypothetical protein